MKAINEQKSKNSKKTMTDRVILRNQNDEFVMSNEAQEFLSKTGIIVRMRGLPYECTPKQVIDFFREGDQSCEVYDGEDGILFVKKPDGRSTGDAFVQFVQESEAAKALSKHKELIGTRYIELFRSTPAEVEQVLRKSQEANKPRSNVQQPPLVTQLPTPQVTLPQRIITSGTRKDCIRLRGLPYEAQVEHILYFLGDNAKNIVLQGVHMVYKAYGQPSGEAFIQMDSEASANQAANHCHYKRMYCGKKVRYVEVFQCSGDDMYEILNSDRLSPKSNAMLNPAGIDNNLPGMGLSFPSASMLPYYEPAIPMMQIMQNPFILNPLAIQQQQTALAASFMNKSPPKTVYSIPPYPQWSPDLDPYKSSGAVTTTTDSLVKPKTTEAEILPSGQPEIYSPYSGQPGVLFLQSNLPRVIPNPAYPKPGFASVPAPVIFPHQVTQPLPHMGVLGVKRSWDQAFPLETATVQGAKRWQTPQVANFTAPGFFPDVEHDVLNVPETVNDIHGAGMYSVGVIHKFCYVPETFTSYWYVRKRSRNVPATFYGTFGMFHESCWNFWLYRLLHSRNIPYKHDYSISGTFAVGRNITGTFRMFQKRS